MTSIVFPSQLPPTNLLRQFIRFGKSFEGCRFYVNSESLIVEDTPIQHINSLIGRYTEPQDIYIAYHKSNIEYLVGILRYMELFSQYNEVRLNIIITDIIHAQDIHTSISTVSYWQNRLTSIVFYNPWRQIAFYYNDYVKILLGTRTYQVGFIPDTTLKITHISPCLKESYDIISGYIGDRSDDTLYAITRGLNHNLNRQNAPPAALKAFYMEPELVQGYKEVFAKYQNCCIIKPGLPITEFIASQNITPTVHFDIDPSPYDKCDLQFRILDEIEALRSAGYFANSNCYLFDKKRYTNFYYTTPYMGPPSLHQRVSDWLKNLRVSTPMPTRDKGIVICAGGDKYTSELIVALNAISKNVTEPVSITIVHDGDEISPANMEKITEICHSIGPSLIDFLDIAPLVSQYESHIKAFCAIHGTDWTVRGFQIKQWALIFSPYRHTILMDTDIIATSNITEWFTSIPATGIALWKDYWRTSQHEFKSAGYCVGQFASIKACIDRREWIYPLYSDSPIPKIDNESGVVLANRGDMTDMSRFIGITIAYKYFHSYFYGDKDIYNLAMPVKQMDPFPGMMTTAGSFTAPNGTGIGMIQYQPDGSVHHLHFTLKPIQGCNDESLPSRDDIYLNRLDETTNLAPIIINNTVEFSVIDYKERNLIPDDIYELIRSGFELSRNYYLLTLF